MHGVGGDRAGPAVRQPLINDEQRSRPASPDAHEDNDGQDVVDEDDIVTAGWFLWLLTIAAGVSGLLFGYDTGVISSTLISIHSDLSGAPLSTLSKSLITSSTSLFALVASPITGLLADRLGRKPVLLLASCLFVIGALAQAVSTTVWAMIVGRSIVGLAVGSASFVAPLYIAELAPKKLRGRLVVVQGLFITAGQVVAYIVGWAFSTRLGGWRWIVGLGALPAVIQLVMLVDMPETPRWLAKMGYIEQAEVVLRKVYGRDSRMAPVVNSVLQAIRKEHEAEDLAHLHDDSEDDNMAKMESWPQSEIKELFSVAANRRALAIACMLQGFQQLCGFNSLMYFSATIFSLVGFTSPTLTSLTIAITNFVFTIIAFNIIDHVGRRRILLYSIPCMVIGLLLCAVAFSFLDLDIGSVSSFAATSAPSSSSSTWSTILIFSLMVYVATYAVGLGCVPWQQSELFPLSVRSLGSGLATATNWSANTVIGLTFLPMMEFLTPTVTFAVYAAVCAVAWWSVRKFYPETMGLSLEEVGDMLREGWGVEGNNRRVEDASTG